MSGEKFDTIVVGTGAAGMVADYMMAQAGLGVLVTERGNSAGSKDMTGERLYTHSPERITSRLTQEAPLERKAACEKVSFPVGEGVVTLGFHREKADAPTQGSYAVLHNRLDPRLMGKTE